MRGATSWTSFLPCQLPHVMAAMPPELGKEQLHVAASKGVDMLPACDVHLARMRAEDVPWKVICTHFEISRATAHRRLQYVLAVAAWRSSGRPLPASWSRRYLLSRLRLLSRKL